MNRNEASFIAFSRACMASNPHFVPHILYHRLVWHTVLLYVYSSSYKNISQCLLHRGHLAEAVHSICTAEARGDNEQLLYWLPVLPLYHFLQNLSRPFETLTPAVFDEKLFSQSYYDISHQLKRIWKRLSDRSLDTKFE